MTPWRSIKPMPPSGRRARAVGGVSDGPSDRSPPPPGSAPPSCWAWRWRSTPSNSPSRPAHCIIFWSWCLSTDKSVRQAPFIRTCWPKMSRRTPSSPRPSACSAADWRFRFWPRARRGAFASYGRRSPFPAPYCWSASACCGARCLPWGMDTCHRALKSLVIWFSRRRLSALPTSRRSYWAPSLGCCGAEPTAVAPTPPVRLRLLRAFPLPGAEG